MEHECYVTLATNDFYAYGCIVLGHSLRRTNTTRKLVALITSDVSWNISQILQSVYDFVEHVPKLDVEYVAFGQYSHPDFTSSVAKVHCWHLTQFSKCVFLNADCLVLQNCDELFERSEFSAVPDVGWPDCFNSGMFVFEPSLETYCNLIGLVNERWHRDGGDQHILNLYFNQSWKSDIDKRLPFIYNLVCSSIYTYAPAFQQYGKGVKVVHFVGHPKPWDSVWNSNDKKMTLSSDVNPTFRSFHQTWLDIFNELVLPKLAGFHAELTDEQCRITDFMANLNRYLKNEVKFDVPRRSSWTSEFRSKSPPPTISRPLSMPSQNQHFSFNLRNENQEVETNIHPLPVITSFSKQAAASGNSSLEQKASDTQLHGNEHLPEKVQSDASMPVHTEIQELVQRDSPLSCDVQELQENVFSDDQYKPNPDHCIGETSALKDELRMKQWEEGKADYLGQDMFDNIWKRLSNLIEEPNKEPMHQIKKEELCSTSPDMSEMIMASTSEGTSVGVDKNIFTAISPSEASNQFRLPGYAIDDYTGMHEWEQGRIDYAGKDSSENIIKRLNFLINNEKHWTNFKDPLSATPS